MHDVIFRSPVRKKTLIAHIGVSILAWILTVFLTPWALFIIVSFSLYIFLYLHERFDLRVDGVLVSRFAGFRRIFIARESITRLLAVRKGGEWGLVIFYHCGGHTFMALRCLDSNWLKIMRAFVGAGYSIWFQNEGINFSELRSIFNDEFNIVQHDQRLELRLHG